MPITKLDVQNFGKNLKDTLVTWGDQIQYGKDVLQLKKVQSRVSNIKSLTTNPDGTSKSREDIAKSLFSINNDISGISNPGIMNLANQTVQQYFGEALKGAMTREQNKFGIDMSKEMSPSTADSVDRATTNREPSLYEFKGPSADKYFAPKLVTVQSTKSDGTADPDNFDVYLSGITQRGTPYKILQGTKHRDKLTPEEELGIVDDKLKNALKVAKLNQSNFNTSINLTPVDRSFVDKEGKVTNSVFRNGKYYNPDTGKEMKVQGLTPITENVNPNTSNKSKQETALENLRKEVPSLLLKGTDTSDLINAWIVAGDEGSETTAWTSIQDMFKGNSRVLAEIWNLKYPNGK